MEKLKVEYVLTAKDFQAFDRYLWKGRRWIFWCLPLPSVVVALPTVLPFFSNAKLWRNSEHLVDAFKSFGVQLIFPAIVVLLVYLFFLRLSRTNLEKNSPELFGKRVTEVTADHLINSNFQGETRTYWSAVKSIAQDETHIYILLEQKEQAGFIIPKRAVGSDNDASLFLQAILLYWKSDKSNSC